MLNNSVAAICWIKDHKFSCTLGHCWNCSLPFQCSGRLFDKFHLLLQWLWGTYYWGEIFPNEKVVAGRKKLWWDQAHTVLPNHRIIIEMLFILGRLELCLKPLILLPILNAMLAYYNTFIWIPGIIQRTPLKRLLNIQNANNVEKPISSHSVGDRTVQCNWSR